MSVFSAVYIESLFVVLDKSHWTLVCSDGVRSVLLFAHPMAYSGYGLLRLRLS